MPSRSPESTTADSSETVLAAASAVLLGAALVAGAVVRWHHWLGAAVTGDEMLTVRSLSPDGPLAIIDFPESARNPPLFALVFSVLQKPYDILAAGRAFAVACSLLVALPIYLATRSITRDSIAAALAAAIVVLDPMLASEGVTFRVYAVWAFVEACRLACLCSLVQGPASRKRFGLFVFLTALLPWLHYGSFPILLFEGVALAALLPGARWLLGAHAVAAVTSIPLVVIILRWKDEAARVGQWVGPEPGASRIGRALEVWTGGYGQPWDLNDARYWAGAGLLVVGALALFAVRERPGVRAVAIHAVAVLLGVFVLSMTVNTRHPAAVLGVPSLGLMLGTFAGYIREKSWSSNYGGHVLIAAACLLMLATTRGWAAPSDDVALATFTDDVVREGKAATWNIAPADRIHAVAFHLQAHGWPRRDCGRPDCVALGPALFNGVSDIKSPPSGKLVVFGCRSETVPGRCTLLSETPCARAYECP